MGEQLLFCLPLSSFCHSLVLPLPKNNGTGYSALLWLASATLGVCRSVLSHYQPFWPAPVYRLELHPPPSSYIDKQMGGEWGCSPLLITPLQHGRAPPKPPQSEGAISTLGLIRPHHGGPPPAHQHFRISNKLSKPTRHVIGDQ